MEDYKKIDIDQLKKLAELGIAQAQEELGYRLLNSSTYNSENLKEAVKWFELSSAQGNALAKSHLATMYKMGLGVTKDIYKAFELYKESSELGSNAAKYYLSEMYKKGEGVEKDEALALEIMKESFSFSS